MSALRIAIAACLVVMSGCATTSTGDWTRFSDGSLDEWLGDEAVPGLTKTFTAHPRFKGETIHVAVLDGEAVAAQTDGLSVAVRDTLYSALLENPGLKIVRVDGPGNCRSVPVTGYFLAVVVMPSEPRGAAIELRVYDIVERQWVSGRGHRWRGGLSGAQRQAMQRTQVADSARGLRLAPFGADESDLLAEHLAAQLACRLQRDGNDETIVEPARSRAAALIAGNLAGRHGIPVDSHGALLLDTRVHAVGDELYQVWALLSPRDAEADLSAIAVSAYATHPLLRSTAKPPARGTAAAARDAKAETVPPPQLLSSLTVTAPPGDCAAQTGAGRDPISLGARPVVAADRCFHLAFSRDPNARLFILNHRVDGSLVRLLPTRCGKAPTGASVRFPRAPGSLAWDRRTGTETFYVVAVRGHAAGARVAELMSRIPDRCEQHDGQTPDTGWLNQIDATVRALGDDIAWQAVRVYHEPTASAGRLGKITGAQR